MTSQTTHANNHASVTSLWDIDDVRPHPDAEKQNPNLLPTSTPTSPSVEASTDTHIRLSVGRSGDATGVESWGGDCREMESAEGIIGATFDHIPR